MIKSTPQRLKKSMFLETFFFILQATLGLLLTSFEIFLPQKKETSGAVFTKLLTLFFEF